MFSNNYSTVAFEAKYKTIHRKMHPSDLATCFKISILKQTFQGLPRALAQVKASNTSKDLVNEIRQVIYFLLRERK